MDLTTTSQCSNLKLRFEELSIFSLICKFVHLTTIFLRVSVPFLRLPKTFFYHKPHVFFYHATTRIKTLSKVGPFSFNHITEDL